MTPENIDVVRGKEGWDPAIRNLAGQAKPSRAEGGEENGHRRTNRVRQDFQSLSEVKDFSVKFQAVSPQHLTNDGHRLAHALQRLLELNPMPAADHLVTAGAQSEHEPSARDEIERGCGLGQQCGTAAEDINDRGAEADALG